MGKITTARTLRVSIVGATTLCVLTGCTTLTSDAGVPADRARDEMVLLVRQTMATAGGDWTARSKRPAASGCTTPDGADGVSFSWDQERAGADDPEALVRDVAATWKQRDYDVTFRKDQIDDGRPLWSAITTGQAVRSISVNASPRRVSIEVESNCGVGDLDDFE